MLSCCICMSWFAAGVFYLHRFIKEDQSNNAVKVTDCSTPLHLQLLVVFPHKQKDLASL